VVGQPLRADPAAVVADQRHRPQAAAAGLGQPLEDVGRSAAGRERDRHISRARVGDHLAGKEHLGADLIAAVHDELAA
jgi:hypothetical protein